MLHFYPLTQIQLAVSSTICTQTSKEIVQNRWVVEGKKYLWSEWYSTECFNLKKCDYLRNSISTENKH